MSCERYWLLSGGAGLCLALLGSSISAEPQNKAPGGRDRMVEIDGLRSVPPADWIEERPERAGVLKRYRIEPLDDDKDPTRITIAQYPKGMRLSAAEQVERWKAQFVPPERKQLKDVSKVQQWTVTGHSVTYLDVRGDYREVPNDPASIRQNYRLLAAYFETPRGPYLIQLVGPAHTVEAYRKGFEDWLKAFR
jgi:hypothetical protein